MDRTGIRMGAKMGALQLSAEKNFAPSATSSAIPISERTFTFDAAAAPAAKVQNPRPSSLGILRTEDLNANNSIYLNCEADISDAKNFFNFEDKENLEQSVDVAPRSLPSKYLKPTVNADVSASNATLENIDWKTLLNSESFRQFQKSLPDSSEILHVEDSFVRGTVSARSTSIGGERPREATVNERFSDYSTITTTNASSSYSYSSASAAREDLNAGKRNPFDSDEKQGGELPGIDLGQFGVVKDPLAFIDEEEKRFEKENQFVPAENVNVSVKRSADEKHDSTGVLSKSEYFLMSTSTVGSLEKDDGRERPNFGLITVKSPKRTPCRMLLPDNQPDGKLDNPKGDHRGKHEGVTDEDVNQFLPSFMEASTVEFSPSAVEDNGSKEKKLDPSPCRIPVRTDSQFKVPFPAKVAKSKSFSVRHSSPIKIPERPTRQLTTVLPPGAKEPQKQETFPIASDSSYILWCGVDAGKSEEKMVTLKNEWNREVTLSLMIRGSTDFKLSESGNDRIVCSIGGLAQKSFFVTFQPSESDLNLWKTAKLVIKPKVQFGGKSLKSTINLYGKCGKSQVRFPGLLGAPNRNGTIETFTVSLGELPNDTCKVKRFAVENFGSTSAFVNLEPFSDESLSTAMSSDAIRLEPSCFILKEKSAKDVTLRVDPALLDFDLQTNSLLGSVVCIVGNETTLGILSRHASRSGNSPRIAGTQFEVTKMIEKFRNAMDFNNLDQLQVSIPGTDKNLMVKIQDDICMKCVNLYGWRSATGEFQTLDVEETLSQTRFNCTADLTVVGGSMSARGAFETIPEESVPQGPSKESLKRGRPPSKAVSMKRGTIYLPNPTLIFPRTNVNGFTVSKLRINNQRPETAVLSVGPVDVPFGITQRHWEIKPYSFQNLPFTYAPKSEGRHEIKVKLTSEEGSVVLTAILKASAK